MFNIFFVLYLCYVVYTYRTFSVVAIQCIEHFLSRCQIHLVQNKDEMLSDAAAAAVENN